MAGSFVSTGSYSNLTRLELEQLRKADFFAGSKALTVGDSALPPEGVVGPGNINAEPYLTGPNVLLTDVYSVTPPTQPGPGLTTLTQVGLAVSSQNFPSVSASPYLAGIFTVTNADATVLCFESQVGSLVAGNLVEFEIQPGVVYTVTDVTGGPITISPPYSGTTGDTSGRLVSETVTWYGPSIIVRGLTGYASTGGNWEDTHLLVDYVSAGVQVGDILLIKPGTLGGHNAYAVGTISFPPGSNVLVVDNIYTEGGGSSFTVDTSSETSGYLIVRPNAVHLFAVPGSGPTGSEQTFLTVNPIILLGSFHVTQGSATVPTTVDQTAGTQLVLPGTAVSFGPEPGVYYTVNTVTSAHITLTTTYKGPTTFITTAQVSLHNTVSPTVDQINAGRIQNLVPAQYALNSSVDRSDAVFDAPAPRLSLDLLGYRVVLYTANNISGSAASITVSGPTVTVSGLSGMTPNDIGRGLTITGAATTANNGTFTIRTWLTASSVTIEEVVGAATDANNGTIGWSKSGPNLANPVAVLNPVIDPSIPSTDQRFTIDYKAGDIRFSCAPQLGGQIKVANGTNATTGRLDLYAVYWAVDVAATEGSAQSLYGLASNNETLTPPSSIYFDATTGSWVVNSNLAVTNDLVAETATVTNLVVTPIQSAPFPAPSMLAAGNNDLSLQFTGPLVGTFNPTTSSPNVSTSISQVGTIFPQSVISFASQPNIYYTVESVSSSGIVLTGNFTGTSGVTTATAGLFWGYGPGQWATLTAVNNWLSAHDWYDYSPGPSTPPVVLWVGSVPTPLPLVGPCCVVWNQFPTGPSANTWLVGAFNPTYPATGSIYFLTGTDLSATLLASVQMAAQPVSMYVGPSGDFHISSYSSGQVFTWTYTSAGGVGGILSSFSTDTVASVTDAQLTNIGATVIGAWGSTNAGGSQLVTVGSPSTVRLSPPTVVIANWILKTSGTLAVAIGKGLEPIHVYTTPDGITWTTTIPAGINSTDFALDATWNPVQQLWGLFTYDSTSNQFNFYTAPDAVTWTLQSSLAISPHSTISTAITSLGGIWVANTAILRGPYTNGFEFYSLDGITWYSTPNSIYSTSGLNPGITASPSALAQFFFAQTGVPSITNVPSSQNAALRFSLNVPLTSQLVFPQNGAYKPAPPAPLNFPARNWYPLVNTNTNTGPYTMAWDDVGKRWLKGDYIISVPNEINIVQTLGTSFVPFVNPVGVGVLYDTAYAGASTPFVAADGLTTNAPYGIAVNPANGDVGVSSFDSTAHYILIWRAAAGDLASFGSDALAQHLSGITITDVKIAVVAGTFVVVVGDSNGSPFYYCGIPFSSSFTQAQTGHGVVTTWIFKSNGVLAIAFPFGVPGPPFIYTTTNGTSWTTTNAEGVFIGLGESASDIAWSASQQLWLMLVSISAGQWRFMTSPDGVNWTNVGSTHSYAGHNIVDIEASGDYWVAVFQPTISDTCSILYSRDAITWYQTNAGFPSNGAGLTFAAGPTQLCLYSRAFLPSTINSYPYMFSLEAGTPDTPTSF